MKKSLRDAWVKALRSGQFKQTTGRLVKHEGYCCLGVLCEVSGVVYDKSAHDLDGAVVSLYNAGFGDLGDNDCGTKQERLISMNDDEKLGFPEIADYIEANIPITGET